MKNQKSFNIFLQSGQKKPGLRRSFLKQMEIQQLQNIIILDDGSEWNLYKEPEVSEEIGETGKAECLVSFQVFQDGEFFAIARLYREELVKEKGN